MLDCRNSPPRINKATFDADWVIQDAVIRELEILGEAAGRVSADFAAVHSVLPWREVTGIRHKLIHDYFEVDLSIVWNTATINVPQLQPLVQAALASLND